MKSRFRFEQGQFISAEVISIVSSSTFSPDVVIAGLTIKKEDGAEL